MTETKQFTQEYTDKTFRYFEIVAEALDSFGLADERIIAKEPMVRAIIIENKKRLSLLITPDEIEKLINRIKTGEEKIYFMGHEIEIVEL